MVGLQGSGKSRLVRARYSLSHTIVSKDHWPNARRREARQRRVVGELLAAGRSVVVDHTNASVEERATLIEIAGWYGCRVIAVYVDVPPEVAAARNAAREGTARVPDVGFYATVGRLVPPVEAEGFDSVEIVRPPRADV